MSAPNCTRSHSIWIPWRISTNWHLLTQHPLPLLSFVFYWNLTTPPFNLILQVKEAHFILTPMTHFDCHGTWVWDSSHRTSPLLQLRENLLESPNEPAVKWFSTTGGQQSLIFSLNATKTRSNLATEDTSNPISKKNRWALTSIYFQEWYEKQCILVPTSTKDPLSFWNGYNHCTWSNMYAQHNMNNLQTWTWLHSPLHKMPYFPLSMNSWPGTPYSQQLQRMCILALDLHHQMWIPAVPGSSMYLQYWASDFHIMDRQLIPAWISGEVPNCSLIPRMNPTKLKVNPWK